jgi:acetoin utilization protein AcuB
MLVKDWMSKPVITVTPEDVMSKAITLVKEHKIRCLPVLRDEQLVGIVTDRDLKRASASDATTLEVHELNYLLNRQKIKSLMQPRPITIPFDGTLDEASYLMLEHKISTLPVVAGKDELVGILTRTDILKAFISLTSYPGRGLQFGMLIEDKPGAIANPAQDVWTEGGRIASILSTTDRTPTGYRRLYLRVYGIAPQRKAGLKQRLLQKGSVYYLIDQEKNQRELICNEKELLAAGRPQTKETSECPQ